MKSFRLPKILEDLTICRYIISVIVSVFLFHSTLRDHKDKKLTKLNFRKVFALTMSYFSNSLRSNKNNIIYFRKQLRNKKNESFLLLEPRSRVTCCVEINLQLLFVKYLSICTILCPINATYIGNS